MSPIWLKDRRRAKPTMLHALDAAIEGKPPTHLIVLPGHPLYEESLLARNERGFVTFDWYAERMAARGFL